MRTHSNTASPTACVAGTAVVLDVGDVWWERDLDALTADIDEIGLVQVTNIDRACWKKFATTAVRCRAGRLPRAAGCSFRDP